MHMLAKYGCRDRNGSCPAIFPQSGLLKPCSWITHILYKQTTITIRTNYSENQRRRVGTGRDFLERVLWYLLLDHFVRNGSTD